MLGLVEKELAVRLGIDDLELVQHLDGDVSSWALCWRAVGVNVTASEPVTQKQ
jgi:hypothetical protein